LINTTGPATALQSRPMSTVRYEGDGLRLAACSVREPAQTTSMPRSTRQNRTARWWFLWLISVWVVIFPPSPL
jgi:hypothetical protein